jgi:hypothetical protein
MMMTLRRNLRWTPYVALLAAINGAVAAENKHDLYFCANLSGQGQVMGSHVTTASGVYRSRDRQSVEHLGFNHIRTFAMTHDPRSPETLFVSVLDGIMRTPDAGKSWRRMTGWEMTEPKEIAFDLNAPDHIYAALPDGIAVSHDRGNTWNRMNAGIRRSYTHALTVDRTTRGRVLAGTELGIYLTEDGAKTWRLVQPTTKVTYDIRQSPRDPKDFLAVTSAEGALRSRDGGRTWKRIEGIATDRTLHFGHFDPAKPQRLVICGWDAGVLVSEDDGKTWVDRTAGLPNRQIWCVSPDPDIAERLYAAPFLTPVHVSDDYGRTWRPMCFEKAIVYNLKFVPRR